MALIGLWHGITINFLIWGLWHGLGLFAHNRWSEWVRSRFAEPAKGSPTAKAFSLGGWLVTFLYVTMSWVWFALPTPALAEQVFRKLVGL
jgi:D-alanyl-lipoteichoic acid acyltransferase DltB (MBOAT superfamily)